VGAPTECSTTLVGSPRRQPPVGAGACDIVVVNRPAWTNPQDDQLDAAWDSTLDPTERGNSVAQLMALISENLPGYSLYFLQVVNSWVAGLQGPTAGKESTGFGQTSRGTTNYWSIQDWTLAGPERTAQQ